MNLQNVAVAYDGSDQVSMVCIATSTVINVLGTFTYTGSTGIGCGGQLNVQGNILDIGTNIGHSDYYGASGAFTPIVINGTGTQYIYASTTADEGTLPAVLTINKPSGTLNVIGTLNVPISNGGGWNYVAGTLNMGTSTVVLAGGNSSCSNVNSVAPLNGNTQFNNLEFIGDLCSGFYAYDVESVMVSTSTTPVVNGNLIITTAGSGFVAPPPINGGTIQVNGNIQAPLVGATALYHNGGGTGTIVVMGTSTQTFTDTLGIYWQMPQLVINKPFINVYGGRGGYAALLGYGNFFLGSTTIQQGEFWIPSSTVTTSNSLNLAANVTIASTGALRIFQPSSTMANATSGNLTITNNGFVEIDAPWGGCNQSSSVTLSGGTSNKIVWAGSGQNIIRYVTASYQTASGAAITAINSVDGGNNTNWTFTQNTPPPKLIQSAGNNITGGDVPWSTNWGVRPGDTVLYAIESQDAPVSSVSDSAGDTYTFVTSTSYTASSHTYYLSLYYATNVSDTPPFSVTQNIVSGDPVYNQDIFDYTGISPSSTLETFNTNRSNTSSTALASGFVSTNFPNDLYFAAMGYVAPTTLSTSTISPFAQESVLNQTSFPPIYTEDFIASTTQYLAANVGANGSGTPYAAILAAFRSPVQQYYPPVGTLDSDTFDTRGSAQLNSIVWQGPKPSTVALPQGTSVQFQMAVSNNPNGPWNFIGPDGTASTTFPNGGGSALPGVPVPLLGNSVQSCYTLFSGYEYFRYRVILLSPLQIKTPTVTNVVVNWSP